MELAAQLTVDKATIVGLVQPMRWVQERQSTQDRRRHGLFMTGAGKTELRREMLEDEARFTRAFSPEELAQLFALLHRIPCC